MHTTVPASTELTSMSHAASGSGPPRSSCTYSASHPVPEGALGLALSGTPPVVHATRLGDVAAGFWLQLISEWGADGDHPGQQVILTVERLLSRLSWLRTACTRYEVAIRWQPELRELIEQTRVQRRLLDAALYHPEPPLDEQAVLDRLVPT